MVKLQGDDTSVKPWTSYGNILEDVAKAPRLPKKQKEFDVLAFQAWLLTVDIAAHPADASFLKLIQNRKMMFLVNSCVRLMNEYRGGL